MRIRGEPVKVRLITKSFAELARHWAKTSVAGMGLVLLLTGETKVSTKPNGVGEEIYLGILQLS